MVQQMDEKTKKEFMAAFVEATKPFHVALGENKQAIVDHAVDAAAHNTRQDAVLDRLLLQHKVMQENQTQYHASISNLATTMQGIDKKLDAQDRKIDQQNLNTGELIGTVKSLANQNKDQYQRISALETAAVIHDLPAKQDGRLLADFFNNKVVQIGIMGAVIIIIYGTFKYFGIDVGGAKELMNPISEVVK